MKKAGKKTALGPLKPYRGSVVLAPGLKLIECITELLVPFIVRYIIDDGLNPTGSHYQDYGFVLTLGFSVFIMAVIGFSATMIAQYVASRTSTAFAVGLRRQIFDQTLSLSDAQLDRFGKSKALNLVNADAFSLQNGVQMFMRLLTRAPFLVIGSIVASFIVSPIAGCIVLGALILCALTIFIVVKATPKHYAALNQELDRLSMLGEDNISGTRVIRAFNRQDQMDSSFQESSAKYRKKAIFLAKVNSFINPLTFFFINGAILLIVALGSLAHDTSGLSVGSIVALVSFLTQSLAALLQFTRLVTSVSKAMASKKRIDAFMALEPELVGGDLTAVKPVQKGEELFRFEDVSVCFGGEENALDHISFSVARGERVGIIGGTGSGKSTLLRLLQRFIDPSEGTLYVAGEDAKRYSLSAVRSLSGLVSQKSQIFKGDVLFNITLGLPYPMQEVYAAMEASLVSEFLPLTEESLFHPVEEGGTNFSGGQKQRLLLCRAILSARSVLLLDDATSALDYKSDREVREHLRKMDGLTLFIVSQRASSVANCDKIIVLDQGKMVGMGDHEALLKECPVYQEIYQAQVSQA